MLISTLCNICYIVVSRELLLYIVRILTKTPALPQQIYKPA